MYESQTDKILKCHNPYFNRWFSAIWYKGKNTDSLFVSQSLF